MFKYVFGLLFAVTLAAPAARAQGADQAYLDFQVERAVRVRNAAAPMYPPRLKAAKVEGEVIVQYVVDEKGAAQMSTFKVIKSTDAAFTESVKRAVSATTFHPAELDGRKVKQLVQQPFRFNAGS